MTNTLFLPELREMLATSDEQGLREFCTALHPARTADYMEGLDVIETWQVLGYAEPSLREEIFGYFSDTKQVAVVEGLDAAEMAQFVGELPPDDAVDLLNDVDPQIAAKIIPQIPVADRRIINRLKAYPEDTAGAIMTTEFARVSESTKVNAAIEDIRRQAEELETIYYLYVVDDADHLRGIVSFRDLMSAKGDQSVGELMERDVVTVDVTDDQEVVAKQVARFDLLAIPVVDESHHLQGIVTHDDIIDVVREEAVEEIQRIGAVDPLEDGYLDTRVLTLTWKRGLWLTVLFMGALLTAIMLDHYEKSVISVPTMTWLVLFIPLIISSGGNSGSQSASLIIAALASGDLAVSDWWVVVRRELGQGVLLGGFLATIGYGATLCFGIGAVDALVIPITLILVVVTGTLLGSTLPLLFRRLGLDPALMSTPFVAGIIDLVGIGIYMNIALWII